MPTLRIPTSLPSNMRIISIDPGHSTGVCFFHAGYDSNVGLSGTMTVAHDRILATFERRWWDVHYDKYLVERPPKGGDDETVRCYLNLRDRFNKTPGKLVLVSPGEWKPWVKANPIPDKWKTTCQDQHQRDAAGMLHWWLSTHKEAR